KRDAPKRFEAHFFNWACKQTELLRYKGDAEEAWRQHRADAPKIEKLMFIRVPYVQSEYQRSRASNALAVAAAGAGELAPLLKIARTAAKRCFKVPLPMAEAYGHLTLASAAGLDDRPD